MHHKGINGFSHQHQQHQQGVHYVEFDHIFDHIGQFGPYQLFVFLLIGMCVFMVGMQNISSTFLGGEMDHWCEVTRLQNFRYIYHVILKIVACAKIKLSSYVYVIYWGVIIKLGCYYSKSVFNLK